MARCAIPQRLTSQHRRIVDILPLPLQRHSSSLVVSPTRALGTNIPTLVGTTFSFHTIATALRISLLQAGDFIKVVKNWAVRLRGGEAERQVNGGGREGGLQVHI